MFYFDTYTLVFPLLVTVSLSPFLQFFLSLFAILTFLQSKYILEQVDPILNSTVQLVLLRYLFPFCVLKM